MSEITLSEYCTTNNMSELCAEWREALELKRAAAEPAKLKDPDWVSNDGWPKNMNGNYNQQDNKHVIRAAK